MKRLFFFIALFCVVFANTLAESTTCSGLISYLNEQLESRFRCFPLETEEEKLILSFNFDSKTVMLFGATCTQHQNGYAWECNSAEKLYEVCLQLLDSWDTLSNKALTILAYFPGDDHVTSIRTTREAQDFALRIELAKDNSKSFR